MDLGTSTIEALWVVAGLIFMALRNRSLTNPEWEDFYFFLMRILCVSSITAAFATRIFGAFFSPLAFFSTAVLSAIIFVNAAKRLGPFAAYLHLIQEKREVNIFLKLLLVYLSRKANPDRSLVLMAVFLSAIISSFLVLGAARLVAFLMVK